LAKPLELPTELRWRCQKCGADVPESRHVPFIGRDILAGIAGGAYALAPRCEEPEDDLDVVTSLPPIPKSFFVPLSGPPERAHEVSYTTGGRRGVYGGWTRHVDVCGPLRLTLIETQELWVEHVMGGVRP